MKNVTLRVGLVDRLEAADRRAVERQPGVEQICVEGSRRHGEVLHDTGQVAEPDVDELDALCRDVAEQLVVGGEHPRLRDRLDRDWSAVSSVRPASGLSFGAASSSCGRVRLRPVRRSARSCCGHFIVLPGARREMAYGRPSGRRGHAAPTTRRR
jgi:hypothetical protein